MAMDWNDFNRQLQNRVNDPGLRYMLGMMYERQLDMGKQLDMCATLLGEFANTLNNFVGMNEALEGKMRDLHKYMSGQVDGVSVQSESLTND
jgi:hypothetical protein